MDVITTAIVAGLTTLANEALGETAKLAITDAYQSLKARIADRFGSEHASSKLIQTIETLPAPAEAARALDAQFKALDLTGDPDVVAAAQRLLSLTNGALVSPGHRVQAETFTGQVGDHNTATFHIGAATAPDRH